MTTRSLKDLSDAELSQLSNAAATGTYSTQDMEVIKTLDDSTLQQLNQQQSVAAQPTTTPDNQSGLLKAADTINAGISGLREGAMDAVGDMASLAANVVKMAVNPKGVYDQVMTGQHTSNSLEAGVQALHDKAGQAYSTVKDFINTNPVDQAGQVNHPYIAAAAKGTGYVGGSVGLGGAMSNKILTPTIGNALQTVAPTLTKSPILANIANQGTQAVVTGAAANPEHPVQGALTGLVAAGPLIGLGSYANYKLSRLGNIVDSEIENISKAGVDPNSIEGIKRIETAIKNNGVDYSKVKIKTVIDHAIQDKIDSLAPDQVLPNGPTYTIASKASTNYLQVERDLAHTYAPITINNTKFVPEAYQQTVSNMGSNLSKLKLIKQPLPKEATMDQMLSYRQRIDEVIGSIKAQLRNGKGIASDLLPYNELRARLTDDIYQSAAKVNLAPRLAEAEQLYNDKFLPFQVYNTKTGKLVSHEDVNDAWKMLNKMSMGRNLDPTALEDVQKTLGPDGVKQLAWARLETSYKRSLDDKGLVNPKTLHSELKKVENTGINNIVYNNETREVVKGLRAIIDGADETLRMGSLTDASSLSSKIPSLLASRPGIQLLKLIGGSNPKKVQIRQMIQSLLTGTLSITAAKKQANEPSQQAQQNEPQLQNPVPNE